MLGFNVTGVFMIFCLCSGLHGRSLSGSLCVIIWLPVIYVYYTHCPGTARWSCILHMMYGAATFLYLDILPAEQTH